MEINEISQLAAVLRENGDQVLNFSSKFSLCVSLLSTLNNSFELIAEQRDAMSSSFHVVSNTNIKTEFFRDLQFLYDFIQKTVSLKLIPSIVGDYCKDVVDLTKFKNLRLLELYKVHINGVIGLQLLQTQLQFLICVRSTDSLEDVLKKCGADENQGSIWYKLKEATFSHNNLTNIDSSLELTPLLHTLDLSHNKIKEANLLSCLPNLKYLNLSFNHLEALPAFIGQLSNRLQVLMLQNNFIEDIREVTNLVNLCELDLKGNCLLEHEQLAPLAHLAALQWLNIEGNPLSFHPQHRSRTAKFLHVNTATVRFLLDNVVLTKAEKKLVGSLHLMRSVPHVPTLLLSSVCSTSSEVTTVVSERPRRVRHATISDGIQENSFVDDNMASIASLLTSNEHLDAKQRIEQLRKDYGERWLDSEGGGFFVQDVLGLERSLPISSSPYEKEFLLHAKEVVVPKEKADITSEQSENNTFTTATENSSASDGPYVEQMAIAQSPDSDADDESEDLGEGEENLFLATVKNEVESIFIVLTKTHICERECDSGNERARWLLETLLSCELLGGNIRLEFDTVKRDRQCREYVLDESEAAKLSSALNTVLMYATPINKLIVYKCMKCSTQFSTEKEESAGDTIIKCPLCGSTAVIEDDEGIEKGSKEDVK